MSDTPTTKVPWAWDWQHISIIGGYVFGVVTAGIPLVTALIEHTKDNPTLEITGLTVLAVAAVGGFFKNRPNSVEEAVNDGKISVSQGSQILASRAPTDPDRTKPV